MKRVALTASIAAAAALVLMLLAVLVEQRNTRCTTAELARQLATLSERVASVHTMLADAERGPAARVQPQEDTEALRGPDGPEVVIRDLAEAKAAVARLGEDPKARDLAVALADIDGWVVEPQQESELTDLKHGLVLRLRRRVYREVSDLQKEALEAPKGIDAIRLHGDAGLLLALYPMSDDEEVVREVRSLSERQGEILGRVGAIRRQRYNQWALQCIQASFDAYAKCSSFISPKAENPKLIEACVETLAEVDPAYLESVVLGLYDSSLEQTKGAISEPDRIVLARRLTDPQTRRKTPEDF